MDALILSIVSVGLLLGALSAYFSVRATMQGAELHRIMNSRLSELVATTRVSAHGEGLAQGIKQGLETEESRNRQRLGRGE